MGGHDLDYNKHCMIPFGAYVQAHQENDPTSTNALRTIDAIYLQPIKNVQGGYEQMNLATERLVTYPTATELPVTDMVIKAVEEMAAKQGIKSLKLQNHTKTIFYSANWIAGVDYENNNNDNQDINEEDDENDDDEDDLNNENEYDEIDQEELDKLFAEPDIEQDEQANPVNNTEDNDHNKNNKTTNNNKQPINT